MAVGTIDTKQHASWPLGVRRGLACRCPACGEGRAFRGFLKVADRCDVCGQALHHHRADDLPPYVTIFIVGHIVGWGILVTETSLTVPLWAAVTLWPALTLALALALMQPIKGAVVGLQYALGMHGFGEARAKDQTREQDRRDRDGRDAERRRTDRAPDRRRA